ncbi:MAG: uracil-DNA glycosylase [Puniceicoccales bacterium]|nr:uracil-DNA glycosylase [Puniceicoccales bacterium]
MNSQQADEILADLRRGVAQLAEEAAPPAVPDVLEKMEVQDGSSRPFLAESDCHGCLATDDVGTDFGKKEAMGRDGQKQNFLPPPPVVRLPDGDKQYRWNFLKNLVIGCPVCNAHVRPGKKVVFGVGNLDADIFFCGEAPGADEEIVGEPFVGRAGQLLARMVGAMGLDRSQVYIGNIMNWRPEMPGEHGNRPPTQEEMEFCLPYLQSQLAIVQPKVIVALGATAVRGLLGPGIARSVGEMRGRWHNWDGIPLMVTFHPSYLLRHTPIATKRLVWEDLLKVMERVGLPISQQQREYFQSSS